jgi:hypothetical protein
MTTKTFTNLITLITLSTSIGCKVLAGDDIAGDWEGEIEAYDETFEVEFDLDHDEDNEYSGSGETEWVCTYEYWGELYWDYCDVEFDIIAETEGVRGEQEITFELENCSTVIMGETLDIECPEDFDLDWDGENEMDGDVGDDQPIELERD